MFCVIYSFKVKSGRKDDFIQSWKQLTQLIYTHEGSLGSRLHLASENHYIAYAQWPSRDSWEKAGKKLPKSVEPIRSLMKDSCNEIKTMHELEMIEDLLKQNSHD